MQQIKVLRSAALLFSSQYFLIGLHLFRLEFNVSVLSVYNIYIQLIDPPFDIIAMFEEYSR